MKTITVSQSKRGRSIFQKALFLLASVFLAPLCALCTSSGSGSGTDSITIHNTSRRNQANRPISVSRPFVQGEIPNYVLASIGTTPLQTQTDVKNRWPDGSVKFAIVSFVVLSLPANGYKIRDAGLIQRRRSSAAARKDDSPVLKAKPTLPAD
jgi:hypothetical protein